MTSSEPTTARDDAKPCRTSGLPSSGDDRIDDLLDRATRRLRMDADLRLEVAQELRSHIDDCVAEVRDSNASGDSTNGKETAGDAVDAAIRHLGDADDLAEKLWRANRRRMKVRAVLTWAGRVTLLPAVTVLVALLASPPVQLVMRYNSPDPGAALADAVTPSMSEDDQLLYAAAVSLDANAIDERLRIEPDDPQLLAARVRQMVGALHGLDREADHTSLEPLIAATNEGHAADPRNAFYPLMRGGAWFGFATAPDGDWQTKDERFSWQSYGHERQNVTEFALRLPIRDQVAVERALAALAEVELCTTYESYAVELALRSVEMLPPPRDVDDYYVRQATLSNVRLPDLAVARGVVMLAWHESVQRAAAGDVEGARQLLNLTDRVASLMAGDARTMIPLLVANSIDMGTLGHRVAVERYAGHDDVADRLQAQLLARTRAHVASVDQRHAKVDAALAAAGVLGKEWIDSWGGATNGQFSLLRRAEYLAVDQLLVATTAALLSMIAMCSGAVGWLFSWRGRRSSAVVRLSVKAGVRIVGLGVLTPAAAFFGLIWLPIGGRAYGLDSNLPVTLGGYAVFAMVVFGATMWLTTRELNRRADTLGLGGNRSDASPCIGGVSDDHPKPPTMFDRSAVRWLCFVAAGCVTSLIVRAVVRHHVDWFSVVVIALATPTAVWLVLEVGIRLVRLKRARSRSHPGAHMSLERSLVMPLLICAAALGVVGRVGLDPPGRRAVEQLPDIIDPNTQVFDLASLRDAVVNDR